MGFDKKYKDFYVIKQWMKDMRTLIKKKYPKLKKNEMNKLLDECLDKYFKTDVVNLINNYTKNTYESNTLELTEFVHKNKTLVGGNGVLFDDNIINPAVPMLEGQKANRDAYKAEMKKYDKDSFEFAFYDLKQGNEKVIMNAWYGIAGQAASHIFNIYCATGITFKGRELISTASSTFEAFMGDNYMFLDMEDVMIYFKNCINDAESINEDNRIFITHNATKSMIIKRLKKHMYNEYDFDEKLVRSLLINMNQDELNLLYYKNNFIEFCRQNQRVKNIVHDIAFSTNKYNSPDESKAPKSLLLLVNVLWDIAKDYVYYDHSYIERIYRTNSKPRNTVVLIDTDSNMVTVAPWINFVCDEVLSEDELYERKHTCENFENICIYSYTIILSRVIKETLLRFLKACNVNKKKRYYIDMKNEYLFSRIMVANVKKAYATSILYKEGKPMGGKLDVKGLAIRKSSTNRNVAEQFKNIVEYDILKAEKIDSIKILEKVENIQNEIKESLLKGEVEYLKPAKLQDVQAYEDPLKEQPYRGMMVWNLLYPENEIITPATFYLIKLKCTKVKNLDKLYNSGNEEYVRIAELLQKHIFENPEKRISSKGVYVLAIPFDTKMPEWCKKYIDIDQTLDDTISAIMPVLETLEFCNIKATNKNDHYSNYITL